MLNVRAASSNLLFGFGMLAIGLAVVRNTNHPWLLAGLFGLTAGGLHQLAWHFLERSDTPPLRSTFAALVLGGGGAVGGFYLFGLARPANTIGLAAIIIACLTLTQFIEKPRVTSVNLPHRS